MARKKDKPKGNWSFIKDLALTPVVVPSTPVVIPGTLGVGPPELVEAPALVSPPGLDPPLIAEELDLIKQLTGLPHVRFVWD